MQKQVNLNDHINSGFKDNMIKSGDDDNHKSGDSNNKASTWREEGR